MVGRTALLFAQNALWRGAGVRTAGRALVSALGSPEEDVRSIAGMLLVRGGDRAKPLLEEAMRRRESLPMVLSVLASLDDPDCEPALATFAHDADPEVAEVARQGLDLLHHPG
jgi:hypothetical protein